MATWEDVEAARLAAEAAYANVLDQLRKKDVTEEDLDGFIKARDEHRALQEQWGATWEAYARTILRK